MKVVCKDGFTVTFSRAGCEIRITDNLLVIIQNGDFYTFKWNEIDYIKP